MAEAREDRPVASLMRRYTPTCRPGWPITYLLQMLTGSDVHQVPVLDDKQQLVGIISQSDLLAALFNLSIGPFARRE